MRDFCIHLFIVCLVIAPLGVFNTIFEMYLYEH